MGHSKADKDRSHERILSTAAARFRAAGIDGVGVADLMGEAGLTHGGFYRHFGSREDLVAEAVERALQDGSREMEGVTTAGRGRVWARLVDGYLGKAHRDHRETSCAVTTLAADVARASPRARAAYAGQVESYLELLGRLLGGKSRSETRRRALLALSALVGALSVARAVGDEALSDEFLRSVAEELKRLPGSLS